MEEGFTNFELLIVIAIIAALVYGGYALSHGMDNYIKTAVFSVLM